MSKANVNSVKNKEECLLEREKSVHLLQFGLALGMEIVSTRFIG